MLLGGLEIPLWIPISGTVFILSYFYSIRTFDVFKKHGIPGPKPVPVFGTTGENFNKNIMTIDSEMCQQYGKFVGTFEGSRPVLMVFDPEWLKEAFVKNFSVFTGRKRVRIGGAADHGLLALEGEHWKHSRQMLSPQFASGKLKKMIPVMQSCGKIFLQILEDTKGAPVDIRKKTNALTLDFISRAAFGIDTESQIHPDNEFSQNVFNLISAMEANTSLRQKLRMVAMAFTLILCPDWLSAILVDRCNVGLVDYYPMKYVEQMAESVIDSRKSDTVSNDFVQSLADNVVEAQRNDPDTMVDANGLLWTKRGLTRDEVIGNSLLFLFAGFQTTADSMMFVFYELAHHPDIQQQLYEEIMRVCITEEITTEQLNELQFLDCCINETLRLYPQGFRFDRQASEDITIQGIHVTKGMAVTASPWVIHRDPEIFENPEVFDPDRFSPERMNERMSTAFMPFGIGNRQCIASRLALIELKVTFIDLLKKFRIEKIEATPSRPIKLKPVMSLAPEQPIMVSLIKRD